MTASAAQETSRLPAIAIGPHRIDPPAALAPMAGITDAPFRAQAAAFGAGLVVSEMVVAQEFVRGRRSTLTKARIDSSAGPVSLQIAGRLADELAETARAAEAAGAAIIDVNMGCPAKKVTSGGTGGSALMRDPDEAARLLEAVRRAVRVPVTVKMRLGWDADALTGVEIARRAAEIGYALVAVHGRTRAQFYQGRADWAAARPIVEACAAPVLINGDIDGIAAAREALARSGAAGVMIGRAAQARPWLPGEIGAALAGRPFRRPSPAEAAGLAAAHHQAMLIHYGRETGARCARKHLSARLEILPGGAALRARLMRAEPETALAALVDLAARLADQGARWPESPAGAGDTNDEQREAA